MLNRAGLGMETITGDEVVKELGGQQLDELSMWILKITRMLAGLEMERKKQTQGL